MSDPRCPIDNELLLGAEQAVGDHHGDAGLPTEESHDTAQTQQLAIPIQEQHSQFQRGFCGGTSGISHHVQESAARPWDQWGYHQLPYQSEDDNQASGWSCSFAGIRQGGSQTTSPQGGQVRSGLSVPVEEEGPDHGYDCRNGLQNRVPSTQQKEQITENYCGTQELQQLSSETLRSPVDAHLTEGRVCNGIYIWRVHHFFQHRRDAINGLITALYSPPIYTHLYGYKLRMKFYLNGVGSGIGKHVGLFVQMMQGEYDDILTWPFTGRITLSTLDQCGVEFRKDISGTFLAKPSLAAFQKPAANRVSQEYGFEEFAPIGQVCGVRYTKNDTMMLKVEISRL